MGRSQVLYGAARFADGHQIDVLDETGQVKQQVLADYVLIATGSSPRHPIEVPKDDRVFIDSDQVFRLEKMPDRLIVVGGGVRGCEYATMLAALGVEVILMDRRTGVVRMLDEEIGQLFAQHLKDVGVDVRLGQDYRNCAIARAVMPKCCWATAKPLRHLCYSIPWAALPTSQG